MSINQNVPSCVASGTNNGCRPNPATRTTASTCRRARRAITVSTSRSCSGRRDGASTACRTRCSKAMNNVGEFFFSSPIDPFDLSKDWGRSDDDQRHRLVAERHGADARRRRRHGVAEHLTRIPGERHAAVRTPRCRSTSRPASPRSRAQPAGRSSMASSSEECRRGQRFPERQPARQPRLPPPAASSSRRWSRAST